MAKKTILVIVGARPNFMKVAPLFKAFKKHKNIKPLLYHIPQHSSDKMAGVFLKEFDLPKPVKKFPKPHMIVVVGDVNASLEGARMANRLHVKLAHIEAGLRSFDKTMKEETNRIEIDQLSDLLFVTEMSGMNNLEKEGIDMEKCFLVGNIMVDNLIGKRTALVTLHRPSNVDDKRKLSTIVRNLAKITDVDLIWPVHPRTANNLKKFGIKVPFKTIEPVGHAELVDLILKSEFVITDSGGIQDETAYLMKPTFVLRDNTERPATIESGVNKLVKPNNLTWEIGKLREKYKKIPMWDGHTAERIAKIIARKK